MYGTIESFDLGFSEGLKLADSLEREYIADTIASVDWAEEQCLELATDAPTYTEESYYRGMAGALHQRYTKLIAIEAEVFGHNQLTTSVK